MKRLLKELVALIATFGPAILLIVVESLSEKGEDE